MKICIFSLLLPSATFLFLVTLVQQCHSAKFLFTFYHDKGSHFGSMRPMMEMLAQRGHHVAFLDTIFAGNISTNFRHIRATIPARVEDEEWKEKFAKILWHSRLSAHSLVPFYQGQEEHFGTLLRNYTEKIIDQLVNEHWDFIIIDDLFWSFGFAIATLKHRNWELSGNQQGIEPQIIVYATAAQDLMSTAVARSAGRNWVSRAPFCPYVPTDSADVYSPNKFTHRILAFYENFAEYLLMKFVTPSLMPNIGKFGVPNFSWYELFSRSVMQFSDSIDRIGWPLAIGAEMTNVGAHCKRPKTLPREFADFIERPESNGTIYIAFGTLADWSRAPPHVIDALMGALRRLRQFRIIFVYNGPPVANLGEHVLLTKWAPQLEILAHPRTRAFISHGGNKSVRECLCAGVPMVVMPIYGEQAHTAHLLLAMAISPVINKFTLTEESVFRSLSTVLSGSAAQKRARKFQTMFLDRPMGAMEEGIFGLERLFRKAEQRGRANNKGEGGGSRWRQFTQRQGMHLDWTRFTHFDLLILLIAICAILSVS